MTVLTSHFEQPTMDDYPTRKTTESALLYRREPVVRGEAADGPLSGEQLAGFDAAGYHQESALVSDLEVDAYRTELDRLTSDEAVRDDERAVIDPASGAIRTIYEVHKISEVFAALVRDPRVVDRARQILGSDVYIHQSRVNHLPGFGGGDFYWHSDFETWHAEDGMPTPRAVSLSLALTPDYAYNGALMVIPGSHKTFVSCVEEDSGAQDTGGPRPAGTPDQVSLNILAGKHGIEVLTGPAGSGLFVDSNCLHGSAGNISPYPRTNVFVVFNSVENACVTPFSASEHRPEYAGARDFAPVA